MLALAAQSENTQTRLRERMAARRQLLRTLLLRQLELGHSTFYFGLCWSILVDLLAGSTIGAALRPFTLAAAATAATNGSPSQQLLDTQEDAAAAALQASGENAAGSPTCLCTVLDRNG